MPGPRKVRIFRNPKKSPNWYVEWRDLEGRRHSESCGENQADAEDRARHIREELRQQRQAAREQRETTPTAEPDVPSSSLLPIRAILRCSGVEVPVELIVEMKRA